MKIGIITFHKPINFGACLQALAMQEVLQPLGDRVELIDYIPNDVLATYKPLSLFKYRNVAKRSTKEAVFSLLSDVKNFSYICKKRKVFRDFFHQYYQLSAKSYKEGKLEQQPLDYDLCFAGSDQIWNPDITFGFDAAFFLKFGSERMVRAAYAASVGKETFSDAEKAELKELTKQFDSIAMREKTGAALLQEVIQRKVENVLDPTLLLPGKAWREMLKNSTQPSGKYIFVYALYQNPEMTQLIEALNKKTGLPIVTISKRSVYQNELARFPLAGPAQFVSLIDHAEFVVTNSFHGTAFSLNFSKQFICVMGGGRNSRMIDLLTKLSIADRAVTKYDEKLLSMMPIDYTCVQEKLEDERKTSLAYIQAVVHIPEERK